MDGNTATAGLPVLLFAFCTILAAFCGLFWQIRTLVNQRWPTPLEATSSLGFSGLFGLCASLACTWYLDGQIRPGQFAGIIALSGVIGLGGYPAMDKAHALLWVVLEAAVKKRSGQP